MQTYDPKGTTDHRTIHPRDRVQVQILQNSLICYTINSNEGCTKWKNRVYYMKLDFSSERSFQARFAKDLQNLSNTSKISVTLHKFRKVDDALPNASLNFKSVLPPINNYQTSLQFISKRFLSNWVYSSDRNLLNLWHKKRSVWHLPIHCYIKYR